ncbi:phosphoenolpyruvate carboxykinase [Clostridium sp. DL1XJH146]
MKKEFSLSEQHAMINFTAKYCDTPEVLLHSHGFYRVLIDFVKNLEKKSTKSYKYISISLGENDGEKIVKELTKAFSLLLIMNADEIMKLNEKYMNLFKDKYEFINLIEELYTYWRKIERYTIVMKNKIHKGDFQSVSFLDANAQFSQLIRFTYRKIEENILKHQNKIFRQLPAGGNAGLILNKLKWKCPEEYKFLQNVPFIDSIVLSPPFITYPKKNTRNGIFNEVNENPSEGLEINEDHWFCYPAKVGELLIYVFFHRDLMSQGVSLCNLFEIAKLEEYKNKKPDAIYIYGAKDNCEEIKTCYFEDTKNDLMLGYVNYSDEIDYFGYMKKMILTLHNLMMIKKGFLPIHGAMVNIRLKNGKVANVVIMGDSGAGKSESLEAFRRLGEEYISEMKIIFDDMGTIKLTETGKPLGYGTEIGAFVRLDDLDAGYAFREIDRSIFMNPDKINARLIIPVASYKDIMEGLPVDLFLYANNYSEGEEIEFFTNLDEAKKVFTDGARMAKGTTTENGLVKSFFANPFGPVQMQAKTEVLIDEYFSKFKETGVKIGQIRTCLGIKGQEKTGTEKSAKKLMSVIQELL